MATNRQYEDLSSSDIPFLAMGNHLHIEIQVDKTAVDPADYIEMPKKNKEN